MSLKEYLEKQKLKPGAFAKSVGCSDSMIRRIILYGQRPGVDLALRIEKYSQKEVLAGELLGLHSTGRAA